MVIEVGFILAGVLGPEGDARVEIMFCKLWKYLQLVSTWAVQQFSKPAEREMITTVVLLLASLQSLNICDQ